MKSNVEKERLTFIPELPPFCKDFSQKFIPTKEKVVREELRSTFPHTYKQPFLHGAPGSASVPTPLHIGLFFSGGPAPGGHNVIAALFDALQKWHPESTLRGFLHGPQGFLDNNSLLLTKEKIASYRNLGGFDMIGTGRTKIEKEAQFDVASLTVKALQLDGLIVIGGDDSNTNAAFLAERFAQEGIKTKVVGIPKTIDGDLANDKIECSFGFDTATKVYSEMIGNLAKDALSTQKYWHFIKLMGRAASHVALECARQTQPNLTLIGEEIEAKGTSLQEIIKEIALLIEARARIGKKYGIILIPEGLIEFIPEFRTLLQELNEKGELSSKSQKLFHFLPLSIQQQLQADRDSHGNVQLSHIETEKLLIALTKEELRGGTPFHPLAHFYGYEGRCALPSYFDLHYCTALGYAAFFLVREGYSGYLAQISHVRQPITEWQLGAVPLVSMMHQEERKGKMQYVIAKKLVDIKGKDFEHFNEMRKNWLLEDLYLSPGPMQL